MATSTSPTDSTLFRTEAQPVQKWDLLTEHQQHAMYELLRRLAAATRRTNEPDRTRQRSVPWLFLESKTQLAFVDGQRGTGKTTLMTTLVEALAAPSQFKAGCRPDVPLFRDVQSLIHDLQDLVVPVQPLDMEPLPRSTPLLAAILARVYRAAKEYAPDKCECVGLLAEDSRDNRELLRFEQYQERVARALESNLQARKGSLDAEQFAESVMTEEDNRLGLVSDLELVLCELSRRVQKRMNRSGPSPCESNQTSRRLIFLVPIDDLDLNPERCLELLRLLRTFSPPRELFFLLMGQYDLVESIVKLKMAAEFGSLWKEGKDLSSESVESMRNEIAKVSVANVRKMVPLQSQLRLPNLSLTAALNFRPLDRVPWDGADALLRLTELFERIELRDSNGKPVRFRTLAALLGSQAVAGSLPPQSVLPNDAKDFRWNQYCATGTFQLPARRLVDLWMELRQLTEELSVVNSELKKLNEPDVGQNMPEQHTPEKEQVKHKKVELNQYAARQVHHLLQQHWRRVVDADPLLSMEARRRLQQDDGLRACAVVPACEMIFDRDIEISDAQVDIPARDTTKSPTTYRAKVRFAALHAGTGVPSMALVNVRRSRSETLSDGTGTGTSTASDPIDHIQTRCAKALYHDIEELFGDHTRSTDDWPLLTSVQPVETAWVGPEGEVAYFPWPLPPLTTFVEMSTFLANWRHFCESSSGLNCHSPNTTFNSDTVAMAIQRWTVFGLRSIEANLHDALCPDTAPPAPLQESAEWEEIAERLLTLRGRAKQMNHLRGWTQIDKWLRRVAQLVQPELCTPKVASTLIPKIEGLESSKVLSALTNETRGILLRQRRARLGQISTRGAVDLRTELNKNPNPSAGAGQWLFLAVEELEPENKPEVLAKLEDLDRTISQIQREQREGFKRSEFLTLSRQGELAMADDPNVAIRLFQQAQEVAERILETNPDDASFQRDLARLLNNLGDCYERTERFDECVRSYTRAIEINRRLAKTAPEDSQAQRDLTLSLYTIGNFYLERDQLNEAEAALNEDLSITRRLAAAESQNKQAQRDLLVSLNRTGDIQLRREKLNEAEKTFQESLRIARRIAEADPQNLQFQRDLSISLNRIGEINLRRAKLDDAQTAYQGYLEIARRLAQAEPQSKKAQRELSISLSGMGEIHLRRENLDESEKAFQESLSIAKQLAEAEPQNRRVQRELSISLQKMGVIYLRREKLDAAEKAVRDSLEIERRISKAEPQSEQAQRNLSIALSRLGEVYLRRKRIVAAKSVLEEAVHIAHRIANAHPESKQAARDLAKYEYQLAKALKDPKARLELRRHAWSILSLQDPAAIQFDMTLSDLFEELRLEFDHSRSPIVRPANTRKKESGAATQPVPTTSKRAAAAKAPIKTAKKPTKKSTRRPKSS